MKFHEKIRFMRQSKNWSQEDMADKLGMSVAGYAKIEQGRTDANFSKLEQIASVFELDVVELLLDVQVFILTFKNSKLRIMKFMFLRLFYVVSNKIKHNTLIYNKLKLLLFNLKSTSYKNLNIEY